MTQEIIRPRRLLPGGTIGIAAPASPFDQVLFGQGMAVMESRGYQTRCPDGVYARERYFAGGDRQRAELLGQLFTDPEVGAIICARGGFGSMRTLAHLDFDRIGQHPKVLVGFSDITALLNVLGDRCGLVGFHGPVVTSLAETEARTVGSFFDAIASERLVDMVAPDGRTLVPGSVTAPLAGGNLTTLCHLTGTPFSPAFAGKILLLEDINEAPYRIDRMLSQMRMAGCFDDVAGLVLGAFSGCGSEDDLSAIVEDIFGPMAVPILSGLEVGHGPVNLTVPIGLTATLDADGKRLFFHEPATVLV
ncbi:MAG: LD-carboxypeptidase [Desulfobacterales bacterium]|nr:LD-carboxypeptidase [Desulfobacterales bacterium]